MGTNHRILRVAVYPLAFLLAAGVASLSRTWDWGATTTFWAVMGVAALFLCVMLAVLQPAKRIKPRRSPSVRSKVSARLESRRAWFEKVALPGEVVLFLALGAVAFFGNDELFTRIASGGTAAVVLLVTLFAYLAHRGAQDREAESAERQSEVDRP
jgi:hypothetical protein